MLIEPHEEKEWKNHTSLEIKNMLLWKYQRDGKKLTQSADNSTFVFKKTHRLPQILHPFFNEAVVDSQETLYFPTTHSVEIVVHVVVDGKELYVVSQFEKADDRWFGQCDTRFTNIHSTLLKSIISIVVANRFRKERDSERGFFSEALTNDGGEEDKEDKEDEEDEEEKKEKKTVEKSPQEEKNPGHTTHGHRRPVSTSCL